MTGRPRVPAVVLALLLAAAGAASAQPESATAGSTAEAQQRIEALEAILSSMVAVRAEVEAREIELAQAAREQERAAAAAALEELHRRASSLEEDFATLATGIDVALFATAEEQRVDWREGLETIFEPIVLELRSAVAHPREVERLRGTVRRFELRIPEIERGLAQLAALDETADDPAIRERLTSLAEYWDQQLAEQQAQLDATRMALDEKLTDQRSVGETVGDVLRLFFRRRGRNLVLAVAAFLGVFFLLRWLQGLLRGSPPRRRVAGSLFLARLLEVAYYLFTVTAAITALLVVLYLSGDWLLLAIAALFLFGLLWALKNTLPEFLDQARLLLDLGPVREGERLIYQGVPWRVAALSFYSDLENPELAGGHLRLPLRDLLSLRSRPFDDRKELWFPTRLGDWVFMADGFYGKVVRQTPEEVVIATGRGSEKSYRTPHFLEQRPKNLSIATFVVNEPVRLSYGLRERALDEVPLELKQAVEEAVARQPYADSLEQVITELKELAESGLVFNVIAKFRGDAASEYFEIGWLLAQASLETCNRNGWEIPYRQVVVHSPPTLAPPGPD